MPAADVTVTAEFEENPKPDGEVLTSTYISRYGKIGTGNGEVERSVVETDAKTNYSDTKEIVVGASGNYARTGLATFNATVDAEDAKPIYRAYVKLTQKTAQTALDNGMSVNSVTGDYDNSTITYVTVYGEASIENGNAGFTEDSPITAITRLSYEGLIPKGNSTEGQNLTTEQSSAGSVHSLDITDYVRSVKAAKGTIYSLAFKDSRRGFVFYGADTEHSPEIEIIRGVPAKITVVSKTDETVKIKDAAVVIKDGDGIEVASGTTNENGELDVVLLPSTEYTYTVTSTIAYKIKKDGSFTTTAEGGADTAKLEANEPDHIVITSPSNTEVAVGAPITFSAKVYDADNRELTSEGVTWSIVDSPANVAVSNAEGTEGQVSVTEGVTAGEQSVKATSKTKESVTQTATFNVNTNQPATITVAYVDEDTSTGFGKENGSVADKFQTESFTLDASSDDYKSYFEEYTKTDAGLTTVYRYDAEATGAANLTIDSLAANNTITLKYKKIGVFYEYYNLTTASDLGFTEFLRKADGNGKNNNKVTASVGLTDVLLNLNYPDATTGESAAIKNIDTPYTGKIAVQFEVANSGGESGKGVSIRFLDNAETPVEMAQIVLRGNWDLTMNSVKTGKKSNLQKNAETATYNILRYELDFTNKTIDAYCDGTQVDLNDSAEGKSAALTAANLATIKIKAENSATNTYFKNFMIEKLDAE